MAGRTRNTAEWKGDLKGGGGRVALGSGAYGATTASPAGSRTAGANPRNCSGRRTPAASRWPSPTRSAKAGARATSVKTTAHVYLGKDDRASRSPTSTSTRSATCPASTRPLQRVLGEKAKVGCIISRALAANEINLKATLK